MKSIVLLLVFAASFTLKAQNATTLKVDSTLSELKKIQKEDSSKVFMKTLAKTFGLMPFTLEEKPKIAFMRSLFLAGWGQYTNRDYWKMGLVYGAAGAGWYFGTDTNNQRYKRYLGHYEKAIYLERNLVFYDETSLTISNALPSSSTFYLSDNSNNDIFYIKDPTGNQYTLEKKTGLINDVKAEYFITKSSGNTEIIGAFNTNTFKSAKDQYRRWRDASIIGFTAGWLFFALEANVAAHMKTFDMSDDISFNISPAGPASFGMQASGVKLVLAFK
jgi:hypothetical protein